jgi:hypothetical protein
MDELEKQYLEVVDRIPVYIQAEYTTKEEFDEAISAVKRDIDIVERYRTSMVEALEYTANPSREEELTLKISLTRQHSKALYTREHRLRDLRVKRVLDKNVSYGDFMSHQYTTSYSPQGLSMTPYTPGEHGDDYEKYLSEQTILDRRREINEWFTQVSAKRADPK